MNADDTLFSALGELHARLSFLSFADTLGGLPVAAIAEELQRSAQAHPALASLLRARGHLLARGGAGALLVYALASPETAEAAQALVAQGEASAPRLRVGPWRAPLQAPHRTLEGHSAPVTGLARAPGGRLFAGALDGWIRAWSLEGVPLLAWRAHSGAVSGLAWTRAGLLSAGPDGATLWDERGAAVHSLSLPGRTPIADLCASEEGALLIQGEDLYAVSLPDGALRRFVLPGPASRLVLAPGGRRAVAMGTILSSIDLLTGTVRALPLSQRAGRVRVLAAGAGGILFGGPEAILAREDEAPRVVQRAALGEGVYALDLSSKGLVLAGYRDRRARLFGPDDSLLAVLDAHSAPVCAVALDEDAGLAITAAEDGPIKLWSLPAPASTAQPRASTHQDRISSLLFLDKAQALSGSWDSSLRLWDTEAGRPLQLWQGFYTEIASTVSLSGERVACAGPDRNVRVWSLREPSARPLSLSAHRDRVTALASLPHGGFVSGGEDKLLIEWDASLQARRSFQAHKGAIRGLACSQDGRRLVSVGQPCELRIWSMDGWRLEQEHPGEKDFLTALVLHPDGRRALLATQGRALRVFDLARGEDEARLPGQGWFANALSLSPCGRWLAASCSDRALRLFDLGSYEEAACVPLDGQPSSCAFSPDGRSLLVGDVAGRLLRFWVEVAG